MHSLSSSRSPKSKRKKIAYDMVSDCSKEITANTSLIFCEELLSYIRTSPPLLCVITASNSWKDIKIEFVCPINMNTTNTINTTNNYNIKSLVSTYSLIYEKTLYQRDYTNGMDEYKYEVLSVSDTHTNIR